MATQQETQLAYNTLRLIRSRRRDLEILDNQINFFKTSPDKRKLLLEKGRRLINDIENATKRFARSPTFYNLFENAYNEFRGTYSQYVDVPKLTNKLTRQEMDNLKAELINKVSLYSDWGKKSLDQKVALWNEAFHNVDENILNGFRPRQVLFSIPKDIPDDIIDKDKLKAYRQHFYRLRNQVQKTINDGISRGLSHQDIHKRLLSKFKDQYPAGKVPVPYRKRVGNRDVYEIRHMNLGYYTDTWIKDLHIISDSKGQIAGALAAGIDVVKIIGGEWHDCPICKQYENKKFSLTGRTKKYPKLSIFPPFHPNCSHIIKVIVEDEDLEQQGN